MHKSRRSRMSKSSRVSEKVMEYYMKYGKDRELEKFMRFRSPGGSQKSTTSTTTSSSSSDDWAKVGNLQYLFREKEASSDERIVQISEEPVASCSSAKNAKCRIVPIEVETDDVKEPTPNTQSPKTPVQQKEILTKQTQTPESTAKSHRRLEWDSLGDVGYKKSKSTSNISIVERMLLREFFEVTTNAPKNTNSSESDIRLLEQEIADLGTLRKHFSKKLPAMEESNYGTTPLASSTHVEGVESVRSRQRVLQSVHSVGTNTSLLQPKTEKYAQTSLRKPEMTSQEVQVTLTSPGISPLLGSSAEPSSFEYRSRLSTNSSEPRSTQSSSKQAERSVAGAVNPNTNQSIEMSLEHKKFETKIDGAEAEICDRLKNLYFTWNNAMEDNKENTSTSSSCSTGSSPPQIDLGIQLICGIMKAKNIDQKQKKRLVRNIVKRITKIANSCQLDAIVNRTATLIDSDTDSYVKTTDIVEAKQKSSERVATKSRSIEQKKIHTERSMSSSHQALPANQLDGRGEPPISNIHKTKSKIKKAESSIDPQSTMSSKKLSDFSQSSKILPATNTIIGQSKAKTSEKSPNAAKTTITTKTSSNRSGPSHSPALDISLCLTNNVSAAKVVGSFVTQSDGKISSSTNKSDATTTSSSKDLPTQKAADIPTREHRVYNPDMREWLDPITQSEVEYESKKRTSKANKKDFKPFYSARSGKYVELNWIDCEIERLQFLKQNLIRNKAPIPTHSDIYGQPYYDPSIPLQTSENLYDTIYSDPTDDRTREVLHMNNRISAKSKQKTSISEHRTSKGSETKETSKPKDTNQPDESKKDNEQQQTAPTQRSKIDTPETVGSESVGSFVRQRKEAFLEHYKNQKLKHYDQIMHKYDDRPSTSKAAIAASQYLGDFGGHFSIPVPIQFPQPTSYYTYPPMHQYRDPHYYTKSLAPVENPAKISSADRPTKSPRASSSEVSVPMGSYNTNSTPTTTHQYDIATTTMPAKEKANIGSQTGRSLPHSRPIYETRCLSPYQPCTNLIPCSNYVACTCRALVRSACVQARPKGVSYSLQFEKKPSKEKTNKDAEGDSSGSEEYKAVDNAAAPSLQVALENGHPKFVEHVKKRKSILNRIQKLRQEREKELREIADDNTSLNSLDRKLQRLPPPAIERLRIFPTKEMKAMTNKRVATLPEVLEKKEREREQRFKRSNRLLRDVYIKRLRNRVRGGGLTLNHSLTLI